MQDRMRQYHEGPGVVKVANMDSSSTANDAEMQESLEAPAGEFDPHLGKLTRAQIEALDDAELLRLVARGFKADASEEGQAFWNKIAQKAKPYENRVARAEAAQKAAGRASEKEKKSDGGSTEGGKRAGGCGH